MLYGCRVTVVEKPIAEKSTMKTIINIAILVAILMVVPNIVSGLFWDFSQPTNNNAQAAAGGAFLGAAGILTLCWIKDTCNRRGKRDTDGTTNVSINMFTIS